MKCFTKIMNFNDKFISLNMINRSNCGLNFKINKINSFLNETRKKYSYNPKSKCYYNDCYIYNCKCNLPVNKST
jgi:hypothetical protein